MVWDTYAVKIEVQLAFAFVKEGVKAYQDALRHLCNVYCQNYDLTNLLKVARK